MSTRRAVVIDREASFTDIVQRALRTNGFEIDVLSGRKAEMAYFDDHDPDIVFLAVERPRNVGFSLFTEVKRRSRRAAVVLTTSTVPEAELLQHQKLTIHADAYLDKHEANAKVVVDITNRVLGTDLELPGSVDEPDPVHVSPTVIAEPASDDPFAKPRPDVESAPAPLLMTAPIQASHERQATDPDDAIVAKLEALGVPRSMLAPTMLRVEPPPAPPKDVDALEDVIDKLQHELELARRATSTSPFSDDYRKLAEQARDREKDVSRLAKVVDEARRKIGVLHASLVEVAKKVIEAEASKDHEREQALLEARVAHARHVEELAGAHAEALLAVREHADRTHKTLESSHRAALREHEAREQETLAAHTRRFEQNIEQLRRDHAAERTDLERSLARKHEAELSALRDENARCSDEAESRQAEELEAERDRHRQESEDASGRHERELAGLRGEHEEHVARLSTMHRDALQARDRQWEAKIVELRREGEEERRRTAQNHAAAIASYDKVLAAKLDAAIQAERDRRRDESDALVARHEEALHAERDRQRCELEDLAGRHERAISRLHDEQDERVAALSAMHRETLRGHDEQWEAKLAKLIRETEETRRRNEQSHAEALASQEHGLRHELEAAIQAERDRHRHEIDQAAASRDDRTEQRLREMRSEMEALAKRHEQNRLKTEKAHAGEIERLEERLNTERRAAIRSVKDECDRTVSKLEATHLAAIETERGNQRSKLDQTRAQAARRIEELKASLDEQRASGESKWKEELEKAERRQDEERERARNEVVAAVELERKRLRAKYDEALENERKQRRGELDELTKRHERVLRTRHGTEDRRVQQLVAEHEEALHSRQKKYNQRVRKLLASHKDELDTKEAMWKERIERLERKLGTATGTSSSPENGHGDARTDEAPQRARTTTGSSGDDIEEILDALEDAADGSDSADASNTES